MLLAGLAEGVLVARGAGLHLGDRVDYLSLGPWAGKIGCPAQDHLVGEAAGLEHHSKPLLQRRVIPDGEFARSSLHHLFSVGTVEAVLPGSIIGILLADFSNFFIASLHLGAGEWRWEFGVSAVPAALFLLMLSGIPHSPPWLVTQGRIEEARETLTTIGTPEPEQEMEAIVASIHLDTSSRKEPLFKRKYRVDRFMTGLRPVALS